jgi:8-oxo-dGTP pyrophosphatase MutT (NUDIX family)
MTMTGPTPILRPSARALVIDSEDRVLLFHAYDARLDEPDIWFTPGGGLEDGEDYEQALFREVWEETGLSLDYTGPWIWWRRPTFRVGDALYDTPERFYLVRVDRLEVTPQHVTAIERESMMGHRWWTVEEVQAATGTEVFYPTRLGALLVPIVAGDIPPVPIDVGE